MTDWNKVQAFMAHVVPWPTSPQDVGYVNLHYSSVDRKDPNKLYKGGGWPFRSVEQFISRAQWVNTTSQFKDVWFCLSLQRHTKPNHKTPAKPLAHRLAANAVSLKAIWVDLDVNRPGDNNPKKYASLSDALKAIITFRERNNLPPFSALVGSGGGLHVYWISKTPMSPYEWAPFASGLKTLLMKDGVLCDAGVTTDAARILRVPGTFNHKDAPPSPVALLNVPLVMYDFEADLALLKEHSTPIAAAASAAAEHELFVDAAAFKGAKPAFTIEGPDLDAGIDKHEQTKLDTTPIFAKTGCPFYLDALLTGGKDHDQPLWNLAVLGTTWMEKGDAVAHAISKAHPGYSADGTQALYDRKVAERAAGNLGYPSCSAFKDAGSSQCATCPLFAKGKSPLNVRPAVTAAVNSYNLATPLNQTPQAKALSLPEGYDLDADGYICKVQEVIVGGESMPPTLLKLFHSKLTDPWAQSDPDSINFKTTRDKGRPPFDASIRHEDMGGMGLDKVFARQHVKIYPDNKRFLEHFIVSWLSKLHEMQAAQQSLPFGWYKEAGVYRGFVFGGQLLKDDGSEQPCGVGDPKLRQIFHPTGDIQHWYDACKIITQQKRPELDAIIALSFAAPLAALIGKNAVTLCAYGDSGVGKSAAFSVGVGVWGHSKKGKATSHSTFNGVMRKMGELANLPLYWDEIKDPKAQAAVYDYLYNASDGVEKDRMVDGKSMQDKGTWQTLMGMAANISFVDFIASKDKSHIAGVSRVLEYNVKEAVNPVGRISKTDAEVIIDKLMYSYGMMGMKYAKFLAMNIDAVRQECIDTCKQAEQDLVDTDAERFWIALVGTLLTGARLANVLGCDIDVPALKTFLYKVYLENREKRNNMNLSGTADSTEDTMTSYFAKVQAADQALWTYGMPTGPGKPPPVSILKAPSDQRNAQVTTNVAVRWDTESGSCYILHEHLKAFLEENGKGVSTVERYLKEHYGMTIEKRVSIGAGTLFTGRARCCVFRNIDPDSDWGELLYRYTPVAERPVAAGPVVPQPIDTGFAEVAVG